MADEERLARIEAKLDRLLALYEHFAPLLEKIRSGKGIIGRAVSGGPAPTFARRAANGRSN